MARPQVVLLSLVAAIFACDGGDSGSPTLDAAAPDVPLQPSTDVAVAPGASPFSETCPFAGAPGRQVRTWGSSGAELEGPELGDGSTATDLLRKPVAVRLIEPNTSFEVVDGHMLRISTASIGADFVGRVRFLGQGTACFLKADIAWLAADGTIVRASDGQERETAYVDGSVAVTAGGSTSTCLSTGETGYLIDLRLDFAGASRMYEQTASVELRFDTRYIPGMPPSASVHATSYVRCAESREIEVALESRGPAPALFEDDSLAQYVLLDDALAPLEWGFLRTRRGLGRYPPGKATVGGAPMLYDGIGRRLHVLAEFESSALTPTADTVGIQAPGRALARELAERQAEQRDLLARRHLRWQSLLSGP